MNFWTPRRLAARLSAAFVVAALVAACGAAATPSPTPPPDPSALLTNSFAATSKITGPLDIALTLDGKLAQTGGATMDISGSSLVASIDSAGGQGELIVDLKGIQGTADIKADLRVLSGTAYLQAGPLGATWYSLPLSAAEALAPSALPVASAVPSFDPSTVFAPLLKDPGVTFEMGSVQQLDGRDQDVVTLTISGTTLASWITQAASMAGSTGVPLPSVAPGMPDVPVTFWIDRQSGQLSKASTTISDAGSTLAVALTIKSHQGSLAIVAPAADQTQDASKLLQMVMGAGGGGANPFGNLFASPAP